MRQLTETTISLVMIMALLLVSSCALTTASNTAMISWRTLEAGKNEAMAKQMPCLVDFFFGEECHRCAMLEKQVYTNQAIVDRINRDFVPVRVDLTKPLSATETALAEEMQTGGECILLFLDHQGRVVKNPGGTPICSMETMSPEKFISHLDTAMANIVKADPVISH